LSPLAIIRMAIGGVLLVLAIVVLLRAFARFVTEGRGTPAPVAPTEQLVVGGDYRFVRNPMYLAVVTAILGQALIFGSVGLLLYAAAIWATTATFVRWYEEPVLLERYGDQYERYRRAVRAWLPRLRPWQPDLD
jgi:protein-S-isoprenylcysteine O-methyltransferase Ste14